MADYIIINGELYHHGIKGMKWGKRRWQYDDGSLTPAGIKRYAKAGYAQDSYNRNKTVAGKAYDKVTGAHKIEGKVRYDMASEKANKARAEKYLAEKNDPEAKAARQEKLKKAAKVGAVVAGTALAAYGAYKVNQYVKTKNYEIAAQRGRDAATKMFEKLRDDAYNDTKSMSRSVKVNVNAYARDAANRASNDNFRTAAKNVVNYKRSGGDLKNLSSLNSYKTDQFLEAEFLRKRRFK